MNLKNISLFSLMVLFLAAGLNSCSPYEEGPGISFRSKAERIANTWTINYAVEADGDDRTSDFDSFVVVTDKDGNITTTYDLLGVTITSSGTWELTNDDETLKTDVDTEILGITSNTVTNFTILKLAEDEMWLKEVGGEETEFHYVD